MASTRNSRVAVETLESRNLLAATPVGMNLEKVVDYNPGYMFTDAFLASRSWFSHAYNTVTGQISWDGGGVVQTDSKGWPTALNSFTNDQGQLIHQRLGTQMFNNIGGQYPAGQYTAHWKGAASINWSRDVQSVTTLPDLADGTHRAVLNVVPSALGMYMRIDAMNAADPLRDMHVWMPDYNGQSFVGQVWRPGATFSPFHPLFAEKLTPFQVVRPLQTTHGISSDEVNWSDRKPVDAARQATYGGEFENGMSWEYVVAMANELQQSPWLSMPHLASDDYIRNLAQLVKATLDSTQKVYVEWSDEPWNFMPGYEAHQYLNQQLTLPENAGLNIYDLWAREMKRDFDVWSEVFADSPQRLVRVVAGQAANSFVASQLLQRMEGKFDAVSCDGYVTFAQPELAQFNASTTSDQVVNALLNSSLGNTLQFLQNHENLAAQYSQSLGRPIQMVVYEGGPLLQGTGQPFEQAFLQAGRDPRMYDLYERLLRGANEIGVDLFTAFVFTDCSPFGDASHLRWLSQSPSEAHKYRAVVDGAAGAIYIPEVTITADATGDEAGPRGIAFRLSRSGDADVPLNVGLAASGMTSASDYTGLPASVAFAAGERSKTFTITPVDDSAIEGDESLTITLLAGDNYRLSASTASRAATAVVRDNDTRVVRPLAIVNPSFETGSLAGWTLTPATGNFTTAGTAITDPNAPTAAHHGTAFVWGAGLTGQQGNGTTTAGISQRVDLSASASGIDTGLATVTLRGWGAGSGTGAQNAQLELAFFDAVTGGHALGTTLISRAATSLRTWTAMAVTGAVPVGARSVEVRAMTSRPSAYFSNRAGFDDLSGELEYSLPPVVTGSITNGGAAQRSNVTSLNVVFTVPVTLGSGAFELRQRGGGLVNLAVANPSGDRRNWIVSFSGAGVVAGSLADGVYDLTLRATNIRDDGNQPFNGGVDAVAATVRRLFGDSDGDGDVDAADSLRFRQAQGTISSAPAYRSWFDFDGDGDIDAVDALRFRQRVGTILPA